MRASVKLTSKRHTQLKTGKNCLRFFSPTTHSWLGDPDPEIREGGGLKKILFSALRATVWSQNKRWGGPTGPSPGSTTASFQLDEFYQV